MEPVKNMPIQDNRLRPCNHCGKIMLRKTYPKQTESWVKYSTRQYCDRECYYASCRPPERKCPVCNNILIQKEKESITEFRGRTYCNKKCASVYKAKLFQRRAKKVRLKKLQRNRCSVEGCKERIGDGLRYLCQDHFENASDVPENRQGSLLKESDTYSDRLMPIIEGMRKKLSEKALVFTDAEYRQDELEFYLLMTPAQRREQRRSHE